MITVKVDDYFHTGTVSNCHGLNGLIRLDGEQYFIEPLWNRSSNPDEVHPHVIFKQDTNAKPILCVTMREIFCIFSAGDNTRDTCQSLFLVALIFSLSKFSKYYCCSQWR